MEGCGLLLSWFLRFLRRFLCRVTRQFVRVCVSGSEQGQDRGARLRGDLIAVSAGHFLQQAVAAQQTQQARDRPRTTTSFGRIVTGYGVQHRHQVAITQAVDHPLRRLGRGRRNSHAQGKPFSCRIGDNSSRPRLCKVRSISGITGKAEAFAVNETERVIMANPSQPVSLLQTTKDYADFHLHFDFRIAGKDANSGVYIRSPYNPAARYQMEVQIRDDSTS